MNGELKTVLERIWDGEQTAAAELCEKYVKCDKGLKSLLKKAQQKDEQAFSELSQECSLRWILEGFRRGDEDAFNEFHSKYVGLVIRLLKVRNLPHDEIENMTQEVFLKLLGSIGNGNFSTFAALESYVVRVTINTANDFYRSRNRDKTEPISENENEANFAIAAPDPSPEANLLEKEIITKSISLLTPGEKNMVIDHYLLGLTYDEIKAIRKVKKGSIRGKLANARKKWKEFWKNIGIFLFLLVSFLI